VHSGTGTPLLRAVMLGSKSVPLGHLNTWLDGYVEAVLRVLNQLRLVHPLPSVNDYLRGGSSDVRVVRQQNACMALTRWDWAGSGSAWHSALIHSHGKGRVASTRRPAAACLSTCTSGRASCSACTAHLHWACMHACSGGQHGVLLASRPGHQYIPYSMAY
jgi:hypothetical protein